MWKRVNCKVTESDQCNIRVDMTYRLATQLQVVVVFENAIRVSQTNDPTFVLGSLYRDLAIISNSGLDGLANTVSKKAVILKSSGSV